MNQKVVLSASVAGLVALGLTALVGYVNKQATARYAAVLSHPGYLLALKGAIDIVPRQPVARAPQRSVPARPAFRQLPDVPPLELARTYVESNPARYTQHIISASKATKVPVALIRAVISAESSFNPYALSATGAVGLMQLMPDTAARYGVKNRLDPSQNILGGARYLSDLMRMFKNNMPLTLAAYNAGEGAVMKHGRKIPPYPETVAYVPKVMSYYKKYRLA